MKYAVISTDSNIDYLALVPITCFSWKRLGYVPVVIHVELSEDQLQLLKKYTEGAILLGQTNEMPEAIKSSTLAQVARLTVHRLFNDDDILIIGDADMIAYKDIFQHEGLVSYGFDLTGRSEIPMCYVKAPVHLWKQLMGDVKIQDLPSAKSQRWEDYWSTDQQLLTSRAREYGFDKITFIDRGHGSHGLPTGRWDRYKWDSIPDNIIDVHMLRSPLANWNKIEDMCRRLWPNDYWGWLEDLYNDLKQLQ